jgi:hypothetical protein
LDPEKEYQIVGLNILDSLRNIKLVNGKNALCVKRREYCK